MTTLCFLDCETTSLNDLRGEVWEIGLIVRNPGQADAEHLWEIRPNLATADPMSLKIARYYERRTLDIHKPGEAVELVSPRLSGADDPPMFVDAAYVARKLAEHLDGAHAVGAVPDFDYRFLRRFLNANNECWTAHHHLIDVEALAVGFLHGKAAQLAICEPGPNWSAIAAETVGRPWKSTSLYRTIGVNPEAYEAHTALGDTRLVRDVYDAITGGA